MKENERRQALHLLRELLTIESISGQGGELRISRFIAEYIKAFDIPVEVLRVNDSCNNVIATIKGENPEAFVVWNGHIDTVPFGDLSLWKVDPTIPSIIDNRMYGRGSSDMKGGLAAMIYAFTTLYSRGIKPRYSLLFIGTGDEERMGVGASHILLNNYLDFAQALFIGEPTGNRLGVSQKGCMWVKMNIKGRTSHSAYPERGINVLDLVYTIQDRIKSYLGNCTDPLLGNNTVTMTSLHGGVAHNVVPDLGEVVFDIRFLPSHSIDNIRIALESIIKQLGIDVDICIINARNPVSLPLNYDIPKALENIESIGVRYFTDASIFTVQNQNLPVFLYGPGDPDLAHQPNEYVEINKYLEAIEFYKTLYTSAFIG